MKISREDRLWMAGVLAGTAALHFHLFLRPRYSFGRDCLEYTVPYARFFLEELHRGRLALFNPYSDAGVSFFAQSPWMGPFYPLVFLFAWLPPGWALNVGFLFHVLLGVAGAYALARSLGARAASSAAGALAFGGSSAFANLFSHGYLPETVSLSYLPLVWLFAERAYRSGRWLAGSHLAAGLVLGLSLLGGHPVCNGITIIAVPLFLAARASADAARGRSLHPMTMASGAIVMSLVLGGAFAAIQYLPMKEAAAESVLAGGREVDPQYGPWSAPWRIASYLFPSWGPGVKAHEYAGILILALAPFAFLRSRKAVPSALLVVVLVCLLLGMGDHTRLVPFLRERLPPFRIFSYFYFFHLPVILSLCMLAALGLGRVRESLPRALPSSLFVFATLGVASLAAARMVARHYPMPWESAPALASSLLQTVPVLLLGAALILVARARPQWAGRMAPLMALLVFLDVFAYKMRTQSWQGPEFRADEYFPLRFSPSETAPPRRFFGAEEGQAPADWVLKRNGGMMGRYGDVRRSAKLTNERFQVLSSALEGITNDWISELRLGKDRFRLLAGGGLDLTAGSRNVRILDLLHVDTVVTRFPVKGSAFAPCECSAVPSWNRAEPHERYFLASHTRSVAGMREALEAVLDPSSDPFVSPIVEGPGLESGQSDPPGSVTVESWAPGGITLAAESPGPRFLVIGEIASSGWRVEIDGAEVHPERANFAFLGVTLPGGRRQVRLRYEPRTFRLGAGTSVSAIVVMGGLGLAMRRRARSALASPPAYEEPSGGPVND